MLQIISLLLPGIMLAWGVGSLVDDNDDDQDIDGTAGNDRLTGASGNDDIDGHAGNDQLLGGAGDDQINGGTGADIIFGEAGNDTLDGQDQQDFVDGGDGNDIIRGGDGNDWIYGADGDDTLTGGDDGDLVVGGDGADVLEGRTGDDVIYGGEQLPTPLTVAQFDAILNGSTVANALGQPGSTPLIIVDDGDADTLSGGTGTDNLILGAGDTGTGDQGGDFFTLLYDQANASGATITDFGNGSDALLVLTDAAQPTPSLSINTSGPDALVLADGILLARVAGAAATLTLGDISVIAGLTLNDI